MSSFFVKILFFSLMLLHSSKHHLFAEERATDGYSMDLSTSLSLFDIAGNAMGSYDPLNEFRHYPDGFKIISNGIISTINNQLPNSPLVLMQPVQIQDVKLNNDKNWYLIFSNPDMKNNISPEEITLIQSGKIMSALHGVPVPFALTDFSIPYLIVQISLIQRKHSGALKRNPNESLRIQREKFLNDNFKSIETNTLSSEEKNSFFDFLNWTQSISRGTVIRTAKPYESSPFTEDKVFNRKISNFLSDSKRHYLMFRYGQNLVLLEKSITDTRLDIKVPIDSISELQVSQSLKKESRYLAEIHAYVLSSRLDNLGDSNSDASLFSIRNYIINYNNKQRSQGLEQGTLLYEDFQITVKEGPRAAPLCMNLFIY